MESTKSGQSKGGILSKACDYIQELRQSNHRLSEELQGLDQLQLDNDVLRQQVRLTPGRPGPAWQPRSPLTQFGFPGKHLPLSLSAVAMGLSSWLSSVNLVFPNHFLSVQVEDLKNKNLLLRAQLRHHGLEVVIKNDSN